MTITDFIVVLQGYLELFEKYWIDNFNSSADEEYVDWDDQFQTFIEQLENDKNE